MHCQHESPCCWGWNELQCNEEKYFFLLLIHHFNTSFVHHVKKKSFCSKESMLGKLVISNTSNQVSDIKGHGIEGHYVQQLAVFPQLGYIKNVVMWLNDRDLAKNEATFLKGPCLFQTIIENNVKIVLCCGHGLALWGQGQTLSFYFNFPHD